MTGIFTISLDFELHWGVFDKKDRDQRRQCYENTLKLIPQLLQKFAEHDVHVTWATVGSLFANDRSEWERLKPRVLPNYKNSVYSAYEYINKHALDDLHQWAHFAPSSVQEITRYPGQELGTHTFSHYYCLEPGQTRESFSADLDAAIHAANAISQQTISLVFPRNQFNEDNLGVCYEKGIRTVRSNPDAWFWSPVSDESASLARKLFRTGDAYLPVAGKTSYPLSSLKWKSKEPLQLPASRLLRSWHPKYAIANKLHLKRVLNELQVAATKKECYHLWWHPENFGDYPSQNMEQLDIILQAYSKHKNKHGMTSLNMGEYINVLPEAN